MSGNYCVYMHKTPDGKRYFGITGKHIFTERWGENGIGYKGQPFYHEAVEKFGWDNMLHILVMTNLSQKEAAKFEKSFIHDYKSNDPQYGYNKTEGGEVGNTSLIDCYDLDGNLLNTYCNSKEAGKLTHTTPSAVRNVVSGVSLSTNDLVFRRHGEPFENEKIKSLPKSYRYIRFSTNQIFQYDLDYKLVMVHRSIRDVYENNRQISRCVYKAIFDNTTHIHHNFVWSDHLLSDDEIMLLKNPPKKKPVVQKPHVYSGVKVYQYDMDGAFVAEYEDIYAIPNLSVSSQRRLVRHLRGQAKSVENHMYSFTRYDHIPKYEVTNNNPTKPVCMYDLEGNLLRTFKSIRDAQRVYGNCSIVETCKGKYRTAHGYVWRYEGDPFDKYPTH